MLFQNRRAHGVVVNAFGVLAAIDLDHKTGVEAEEIEYVATEWNLTSEFPAADLTVAKPHPEPSLYIGFAPSQAARRAA